MQDLKAKLTDYKFKVKKKKICFFKECKPQHFQQVNILF
jgi:hypothetical protein